MREYTIKQGSSFVLPGDDVMEGGQVIRLDDNDARTHADKLEKPPAAVEEPAAEPVKAAGKKK